MKRPSPAWLAPPWRWHAEPRRSDDAAQCPEPDGNAWRGIVVGLALAVPFWAAVLWLILSH